MDTRKAELREAYYLENFIGKTIADIKCYQANGEYVELYADKSWLIDAGLTIHFTDGTLLTLGWSMEMNLMRLAEDPIAKLTKDLEIRELDIASSSGLKALQGQTIKQLQFVWGEFELELEDGRKRTEASPYAMIVTLANDTPLILATVNMELTEDSANVTDLDLEGELLVSVDPALLPALVG